jgi:hypothetical protein
MRRLPFVSLSAAALFVLAGCASQTEAPAPAPPVVVPAPVPAPAPAPTPVSADWRDWPLTSGSWVYRQDERGSIALFGQPGEEAQVTLRCDRARQRLYLSRRGEAAAGNPPRLTVRTTSTARTLAVLPTGGTPAYLAAELQVSDTLVDAIGYSRGRFVLEGASLPTLVIPAWAEILRVAEDCRG